MLVIGRFVIQGELGRDGTGVVYEAHDPKLRRSVSIKLSSGSDPARVQRFVREAQALTRLRHPHLVAVHEVGEHEGRPYLVRDLVRGRSLQARIEEGPLPEAEAVELAHRLALALVHVHEMHLIHRDVTPASIVIDEAGQPHLTDFGLTKDLDPPRAGSLTADGTFLGTAGFLAPEQARGEPISPAADLHGLGATLYAMLTQQTPYPADPSLGAVLAGFDRPPQPPSRLRTGVHADLDRIVSAMLAPAPEQRPTAAAVADALDRYRGAARAHSQPVEDERRGPLPAKQADMIGRYVVLEELGRGAMGVVLRAYDGRHERQVAIKLLKGALPAQRRRLAREGQALSRLHHPNVVELLDAGEHGGRPFVVLELVEGRTLDQRLHDSGPLDPVEAAELGADLAGALAAAHALGVVHRDVKPDNVLVDAEGRCRLADFGLVKDLTRVDQTERLTQTGRLFGTPGFWSPEQAAGAPDAVGPPTDVYSLGATLHTLLTGKPLFEVSGLLEAAIAAREWNPPSVRAQRPEVSSELDAILLKCLAKEPSDRPTASELERRLRESIAPGGRAGLPWPALLGLTLGVTGLALALATDQPSPPSASATAEPPIPRPVAPRPSSPTRPTAARDEARRLIERGRALSTRGSHRAAVRALSAALELEPGLVDAYHLRARAHMGAGELARALEDLTRVVELSPSSHKAYLDRGLIRGMLGRHTEAIQDHDKALELNPRLAAAHFSRGNSYRQLGDDTRAAADLTKAIELDPKHAAAYNNRAGIYGQAGRYAEAIQDFTSAIRLTPGDSDAHFGRGNALMYSGKHAEAVRDYSTCLRLKPGDAAALLQRGAAYALLGEDAKAIADLTAGVELDPSHAPAHARLGFLHMKAGRNAKALDALDRAIALDPKFTDALYFRGSARAKLGQHARAIESYSAALELEPNNALAISGRAQSRRALGLHVRAARDLKLLQRLNPALARQIGFDAVEYIKKHLPDE